MSSLSRENQNKQGKEGQGKALSPRIVAVHGLTGTGKCTVFPLAITHWTDNAKWLQSGLTICAQPLIILAQQLCERVKTNRKMHPNDRTVGYVIAKESSRDSSTKLLYCTEAIVAMMMQAYLVSSDVHITIMSHDQYLSQVRSADLAQLEESHDFTFSCGRKIVCKASILMSPTSTGADACK